METKELSLEEKDKITKKRLEPKGSGKNLRSLDEVLDDFQKAFIV